MKIAKNKIRIYFYAGSIISIVLLFVLFYLNMYTTITNEFNNKVQQLSAGIINEKKRFLQNAVDTTIQMIEYEITLATTEFRNTLTPDEIDNTAKDRIRSLIHNLKLIDNGYIWVNRIVDYSGGNRYAIREIHPNLPETEGSWLSTETEDIAGNKPYQEELNSMNENGELFFEYYFKKLDSEIISHKMSYAKLYKPFDWVIATGVYLDDVDALIHNETIIMQETYKNRLTFSLIISMAAVIMSIVILIVFERQISILINKYEADINFQTKSMIKEKEKTEKALKEKEVLLYEIHHRVKNNLNVVSSLLGLQMINLDNKGAEALQDSINRIKTMSKIHETLYESGSLAAINLREYLADLVNDIIDNYSTDDSVKLNIESNDILVSAKQASPIGLIINELATNCMKYSFDNGGIIDIKISLKNNDMCIVFSDNGKGFPEDFNFNNSDTLGLKLVNIIAEGQLGGSIDFNPENSTFTTKFKLK